MKIRRKRCALCGRRIWGVARLYQHYLGTEPPQLVLQTWVHNSAPKGRKGCDQLLTEAITKRYVENGGDMRAAVSKWHIYETRGVEGVHKVVEVPA